MTEYRISSHALQEMHSRRIEREMVDAVMSNPAQKVPQLAGIVCYQSKIDIKGKTFLLRVMVNEDASPPVVVTAYRTSKIDKYWRDK